MSWVSKRLTGWGMIYSNDEVHNWGVEGGGGMVKKQCPLARTQEKPLFRGELGSVRVRLFREETEGMRGFAEDGP